MRTAKEVVTQVETRASLCEDKILNPDIQDEINQANLEVCKSYLLCLVFMSIFQ